MDSESSDTHDGSASPQRQSPPVARGRRRGSRGRPGTRRAPVRGRRRHRNAPIEPNRAEIATTTREERSAQLRERVDQLDEERLRSLVIRACDRDPSFVLEVVNESSDVQRRGYHPLPEDGSPSWCVCTKCREMPRDEEKVCCGQMPMNCFSTLPDFSLIALDEVVLGVAQRYREDVLAAAHDNDYRRKKRHTAYRQFILWHHGYLGAGNRRVIPSCCVWKIRDKYPDEFGNYVGFVGGRLG